MVRHGAAEGLILGSTSRLITDEVRICTAKAGRTYSLMSIDHHFVFCRLLEGEEIMVDERLAVVMLSDRKDIAYITALDGVVAILDRKSVV